MSAKEVSKLNFDSGTLPIHETIQSKEIQQYSGLYFQHDLTLVRFLRHFMDQKEAQILDNSLRNMMKFIGQTALEYKARAVGCCVRTLQLRQNGFQQVLLNRLMHEILQTSDDDDD